jgi:hypothetical protein
LFTLWLVHFPMIALALSTLKKKQTNNNIRTTTHTTPRQKKTNPASHQTYAPQ